MNGANEGAECNGSCHNGGSGRGSRHLCSDGCGHRRQRSGSYSRCRRDSRSKDWCWLRLRRRDCHGSDNWSRGRRGVRSRLRGWCGLNSLRSWCRDRNAVVLCSSSGNCRRLCA